jgi:hypothetical protein
MESVMTRSLLWLAALGLLLAWYALQRVRAHAQWLQRAELDRWENEGGATGCCGPACWTLGFAVEVPVMQVTFVRVQLSDGIWGVTLNGADAPLVKFTRWDDAVDHARSLAVENAHCVFECRDERGRVEVREEFYSDESGDLNIRSIL